MYYAYLKFEQCIFDFQILMVRKKRRMQRMMMRMMKGMKLKRRERKMTGHITWGSERRCRDMKHHLLVFDDFLFFILESNLLHIHFCQTVSGTLFNDFLSVSITWETFFFWGLISDNQSLCVCFLRAREQKTEQPLTFWHPQIPSKKKPYKVGSNLWKIQVNSDVRHVTMCDS